MCAGQLHLNYSTSDEITMLIVLQQAKLNLMIDNVNPKMSMYCKIYV